MMAAPSGLPADEARAWHDLADALGHVTPLAPSHAAYVEALAFALAVARRAARWPQAAAVLSERRRTLVRELGRCGLTRDAIAGLVPSDGGPA